MSDDRAGGAEGGELPPSAPPGYPPPPPPGAWPPPPPPGQLPGTSGQPGQWAPPAGYPPPGPYYSYGPPRPADAFGRPLAGWWQRVGALVIDGLLVGIPSAIVAAVIAASTSTVDPTTGLRTSYSGIGSVSWFLVLAAQLVYFAALDGTTQTVGKRALGIAVRDLRTGQPIGFWRAFGRWLVYNLLWYALIIPGALNALSPLWDSRRQAWHDHAVGSVVIQI